uniref:Hemicentin-1 n=1 Tax=Strigamia maritima TaxID=126957 RepID=T1IJ50_STRMM
MAFSCETYLIAAYFITRADGGICFTKMIGFSCYTDTTYFIADSGRLCCDHYDAIGYTDSNRPSYDFNLHTNRHYTSCSPCGNYLESESVICFTRARHNACWNVQRERKASPRACCENNLDGGYASNLSLFINPEGYVAHYTCTSCTRLHVAKVWAEWTPYSSCSSSCGYGVQQRYRSCLIPPQIGLCEGGDFEVAPCLIQNCENCKWSEWKIVSSCNVTCGTGVRIRQRHCIGSNCSGNNIDYHKCNRKSCPTRSKINGNWGAWSTWDVCSKTCGDDGFQIRRRICDSPAPLKLGMECLGPEIERIVCNDNPCPLVRGQWSEWSDWSKCSKYCGIGEMIRTRVCNSQIQAQCDGSAEQSRKCVLIENCPIDGDWGVWSAWTTCSKSCGKGKMFRTRECDNPAPADGGKECEGHKKYSLECVLIENCPIDGGWGDWSAPTKCSKSCGRGESNQYRSCDNPTPQFRGKNCTGHSVKSVVCNSKPCPIHGRWSAWSAYSACILDDCNDHSKGGHQTRSRSCNNPSPKFGGKMCTGKMIEKVRDGNWGSWSSWSACSKTCDRGIRTRNRRCDSPAPSKLGEKCEGINVQRNNCIKKRCPIDGQWGKWSGWSKCSKTCGNGKRFRTRECNEGRKCEGQPKIYENCVLIKNCPIDGGWGYWSAWSKCSKSCGGGVSNQHRSCDNPPPLFEGKMCTGHSKKSVSCNKNPCPIDGQWSAWSTYSACIFDDCNDHSKGGRQMRSRSCNSPRPRYGGKMCTGKMFDKAFCIENDNCASTKPTAIETGNGA